MSHASWVGSPLDSETRHPPTALRLRADVTLLPEDEGGVLLDRATGLRLVLGMDAAALLHALPAGVVDRENDAVAAFLSELSMLGLFEPTPLAEAVRAQGAYILEQASLAEVERIRDTVKRAATTTRLHRERLGPVLAGRADFRLEDLPILQKADIRRHFPAGLTTEGLDLRAMLRTRDLVIATTSGTTGERLQVYSDTRISRLPPNALDFWRLSDVPRDRPVRTAVFTSPNCSGTTCTNQLPMEDRISFEHTLFLPSPRNPFHMSDDDVQRIAEEMRSFAADFWLVNPVYLAALAERATACGATLPRVSAILYTYQYLSHCQRRTLARLVGAPVFALYTATELGGSQIGVGCPEGSLHVRLDQTFVELLDDRQRVRGGELGSVTVTSHHPTMPLVRYALGDLARMNLAPCPCDVGSSWPTFTLEGRKRDAFVISGRVVTTKNVDDALRDVALSMYQLSEIAPGRYRLEAIPEKQAPLGWRDAAIAALRKLLVPEALVVEEVCELLLDDSQKFRFTCPFRPIESA